MTRDARALEPARVLAGLSLPELWRNYFAIGGNGSTGEVEAYLRGALQPTDHEYDLLAQAINDQFVDLGLDHPVPYADSEADEPEPNAR
jgi:hypothetical protein